MPRKLLLGELTSAVFTQHNRRCWRQPVVQVFCVGLVVLIATVAAGTAQTIHYNHEKTSSIDSHYGNLPLGFEPNRGQTDEQVQFLARGRGYTLFVTADRVVVSLTESADSPRNAKVRQSSFGMRLMGAAGDVQIQALDPLPGRSNYFIGTNATQWITNIKQYGRIRYRQAYPGIDLVYYGTPGRLEYDFAVAPHSNAKAVMFELDGAQAIGLSQRGDLVVSLPAGTVSVLKPVAYQTIAGRRRNVAVKFVLRQRGVTFDIGAYDHTHALLIDPVLLYSTFSGGSKFESASAIAVSSSGSAYVTGQTSSVNFPKTAGSFQTILKGPRDVFVSRLNGSGTALLYSTYLGGSGDETGGGIAVDSSGNAYVTGQTFSTNFPVTATSFQTQCPNAALESCAFVTKIGPTGSTLAYSSYLSGGDQSGTKIAIDGTGHAYVAGTSSANGRFVPTTAGAFKANCTFVDKPFSGCIPTGYIAKFSSSGASLVYASYLGGFNGETTTATGVAVDSFGNAYVTGASSAGDFPTTNGSVCGPLGPTAFITKFNSSASALVYSACVGVGQANSIALDKAGNAFMAGTTSSTSFPTTPGAFQTAYPGGSSSAFVSKLNSTGTTVVYATYLGGGVQDQANSIAVNAGGQVYVTGWTRSPRFPVTANRVGNFGGGADVFVTTLNTIGSGIAYYSAFLGGSADDFGNGIALDSSANAYVAGQTASSDFRVTPGSFQPTYHGGIDAFVSKLVVAADLAVGSSPSSNSVAHGSNLTYTLSVYNNGPDIAAGNTLTDVLPSGTTFVSFTNTNGTCIHPNVGSGGTFRCTRSAVLNKGSYWGPITLTLRVDAASGSTLKNTASVVANTQDISLSNNSSITSVKVQ